MNRFLLIVLLSSSVVSLAAEPEIVVLRETISQVVDVNYLGLSSAYYADRNGSVGIDTPAML